nr:glycoside hydrolase family 6 protein [Kibdelosporangium sp. MJ126-NF4]
MSRHIRRRSGFLAAACVLTIVMGALGAPLAQGATDNPYFDTDGLFVGTDNSAKRWLAEHPDHPRAAEIRIRIGNVAQARWVGPGGEGGYTADYVAAAAKDNKLPMLVAYAVPDRDCGGHSSGGLKDADAYIAWAGRFSSSIGNRPAVVVLEPDSTLACFDSERVRALRGAIDALTKNAPKTWVYLDAGDGRWNKPEDIAPRFKQIGTQGLRGFSVNVSNYNTRKTVEAFAKGMREQGIGLPYVWDISRNGAGPDAAGNWCNPAGRELGALPQAGGAAGADASLWIKHPGTSDGDCGAYRGTSSGEFTAQIAGDLIDAAGAP